MQSRALATSALLDLDAVAARLAGRQVVFVGESHNRYEHHLNQLEIIRRLHAVHPDLAIGMEFFQRPFQLYLDQYVAGTLDEKEMLKKTEYYRRWRFDYRLYRPILRYAREHGIPLLALNVPEELSRRVGAVGLSGLSADERARLPAEIDRSDSAYQARLRAVFNHHPAGGRDFERFVEAQLVWDEGMAETAAEYLRAHPGHHLVVLAGSGHIAYGSGIPQRLERRAGSSAFIVLNGLELDWGPAIADFLLLPESRELPPAGRLGVFLDDQEGGVAVVSFDQDSAAQTAGLKVGDRIVSVDGEAVASVADLKIALLDRDPGAEVAVQVRRRAWLRGEQDLSFEVSLR